jgi:putative endonuclease
LQSLGEMSSAGLQFGESGENLAVRALERDGYAIVARRDRVRTGEIDIIALDGACLVFVEVKARHSARFGGPAAAVTPRKRRKIIAVARDFLARHRVSAHACRFDVVTVVFDGLVPRVEIIRNAFDAP